MATENQHKENSFTPVTAALELADYVFQITGNLKWFPDCSVKEQREGDKVTQLLVFRDDSLVNIVREGKMTRAKFDECYSSWKAHAKLGNSYKLLRRMDAYVKDLMREDNMKIIRNDQPIGERHRIENTLAEAGNTAAVTSIAFVTLAEKGDIDEVTAGEHSEIFAEWVPGVEHKVGQIRRRGEDLYKCLQAHTSQEGWEPETTPALWKKIGDPAEEWPEWSQPIGAHDAYAQGDKVTHQGKHWVSDCDGNVWEPGVAMWTMQP